MTKSTGVRSQSGRVGGSSIVTALDRVGQRTQVVEPLVDELSEVQRLKIDSEPTCIHSGKEKEIVNDAGEPIGLVNKGR